MNNLSASRRQFYYSTIFINLCFLPCFPPDFLIDFKKLDELRKSSSRIYFGIRRMRSWIKFRMTRRVSSEWQYFMEIELSQKRAAMALFFYTSGITPARQSLAWQAGLRGVNDEVEYFWILFNKTFNVFLKSGCINKIIIGIIFEVLNNWAVLIF